MSLTAAPRSSVVHAVGHPDHGASFTRCGRRIGDEWAGEYTAAPEGPATCARCIKGAQEDQAALEAAAPIKVGQRVGIKTGFQSVGGAWIGSHGVVTGVRAYWNGKPSYLVRADGEIESFVYDGWMLSDPATDDAEIDSRPASDETARQEAMRRHPAGKGRKIDDAVIESVPTMIRGYQIRRATLVSRDLFGIMGWNAAKREYVVASMRAGDAEWGAGFYTRNMGTADRNFRARFGG